MAVVVRRCCALDHAGLEERRAAWQQGGVRRTRASQSAQLPDLKAVRPAYRALPAPVLQDVRTRLDRADPAFVPRVPAGEAPGVPRVPGRARYHSFPAKQVGTGATRDHGSLVLSTIGR